MMLLGAVFVLYLVNVSLSLSYEDLARDECFKKIYLCGDHRVSITGGTGRLVTEPYKFGEICRRHKEFIACIDDSSSFCANNFTDLALMTFDNRRSVKMFCTDFEWKKNYFQWAGCINRREQEVKNKCRLEEEERIDDRPWWCLIPEPCEAIQRVFDCTVEKMEKRCGSIAAEVYRRIHLLKVENQDVVCEFRLQNPRYCRYQRATQNPHFKVENDLKREFTRRTGSTKSSSSDYTSNLISNTIIDSFQLLHEMKLLSFKFPNSKNFLLKNLLDINYNLKKLLRDFHLFRESSNNFVKKNSSFYETFDNRIYFIKDSIFKLYELLKVNKDFSLVSDGHVEFRWEDLQKFPIDYLSCFWLKSSRNTFTCNIKVMFLKQGTIDSEDFDYNLWKLMSEVPEVIDVEDLMDTPEFEPNSVNESEDYRLVYDFRETQTLPYVSIAIDDSIFISTLNLSDIHRAGLEFDDSERKSEDTDSFLSWNVINTKCVLPRNSAEEPNWFVKENGSFKFPLPNTYSFKELLELRNEKFQLRKLEEVLHKRFQNLNIVSEINDSKSSEKFCKIKEAKNY